jgi:addiction module RelE/StbE family toxin
MKISFHKKFLKSYHKLTAALRGSVDARIKLFMLDPFASALKNHALIGKFKGYRSINITGDYRAIYKELKKDSIIFVLLGTHSQLYG